MSKIILTFLAGNRKDESLEWSKDVRIGRGKWNDVVFEDSPHNMVSRNHAVIGRHGDRWVVTDSNSRSGTYLNDKKITEAELSNQDILRFGSNGPEVRVTVPVSQIQDTVEVVPQQTKPRPSLPAAGGLFRDEKEAADQVYASPEVAELHAQLKRMAMLTATACGIMLLIVLLALARVMRTASVVNAHAERLDKLDASTVQLVERLSLLDLDEFQRQFQAKSEEMEARARTLEQRYQSMFDRKSREVDRQMDAIGDAFPLLRGRLEKARRGGK